jgi:rare lipoprotein A
MTLSTLILLAILPRTFDASVYSDSLIGNTTYYGEVFTQKGMTCASLDYPYNTKLDVTFEGTTVRVRVNDILHERYRGKRIDLARTPWLQLGNKPDGLHKGVKVEVVK